MFFKNPPPSKILYLLLFGLFVRLVLAWLPEKYLFYVIYDDAYYYFAIARNLVSRGMLSADGITITNGFHPLWLFVITPVYLLFSSNVWLPVHLVLSLSAVLDTAAAWVLYNILGKLGKPQMGLWVTGFYLVHPCVLQYSMSGLETALNSFLLALLVFHSLSESRERLETGWLRLGLVCGLVLLARTDNLFAVGVFWAYLFWRDRRLAPIAKSAAVAAAVALPWLGYNLAAFGTVVQTSGKTFPWLAHQAYLNEHGTYFTWKLFPYAFKSAFYDFARYAYHYGNWILTLVIGVFLVFQLVNRPQAYRPLWWALAGAGLFIFAHIFVRWSMRPWYAQSAFVLTLPAVVLAFERINRYLVVLGAVLVLYFASVAVWSPAFFHRIDRFRLMLEVIRRDLPARHRVGAFNSGYLQYMTDRKVINLDGFVNNEVLSYYQKERGLAYFRKTEVKWLIDFNVFICVIFGPYFGSGAEKFLYVAGQLPDSAASRKDVLVVAVLPDSLNAPPGRQMPIFREWVTRRRWGPIPWPQLKWQ